MKAEQILQLAILWQSLTLISALDLADFCQDGPTTELRYPYQLEKLNSDLNNLELTHSCSEYVVYAVHQLLDIVKQADVCSAKTVEKIVAFKRKYLQSTEGDSDSETDSDEPQSESLPMSLVKFAIAFGLTVSNDCKRRTLVLIAESEIRKPDLELINKWTDSKSAIGQILGPIIKPMEIFLPSDFVQVLPDGNVADKLISGSFNGGLDFSQVREICEKRFEPIYKPLFMPIASLARAGLDYKDSYLAIDIALRPDLAKKSARWSKIIFLCEFAKVIRDSELDNSDNRQPITRLDKIQFQTPREVHIESDRDILGTWYDIKMKRAIKAFKADRSGEERMLEKLIKRSWRLLLARAKYGEYKQLVQKLKAKWKGEKESDELEEVNEELMNLVESKDETKLSKLVSKTTYASHWLVGRFTLLTIVLAMKVWASVVHRPLLDKGSASQH